MAKYLMIIGGLLMMCSALVGVNDGDDAESGTVTLSDFSQEVANLAGELPIGDRQSAYGKYMAMSLWVDSTSASNTSQVDQIHDTVKAGVSVPGLGDVVEAEALERDLKKPVDIDDVRSDWVAFLEEIALGFRYAESKEE